MPNHSREDAQDSDWAPFFGDFIESEKLVEIKPPLSFSKDFEQILNYGVMPCSSVVFLSSSVAFPINYDLFQLNSYLKLLTNDLILPDICRI